MTKLKAPFPYWGGKSRIASLVWERFGDAPNYCEPFFGSGAILLARPTEPKTETVNDINAYLTNFWRSVQAEPECVAYWCDKPVNEIELHSVHRWLQTMGRPIVERLREDPDFYDSKIAGWWVWGLSCWIGSGWCESSRTQGIKLSSTDGVVSLHKKMPTTDKAGVLSPALNLIEVFTALQERLRFTRVCCGDWKRVLTDSVTTRHGITAVFLDPPYENYEELYGDKSSCSNEVREWAIANGENPMFRIALCGYEGEHAMPDNWEIVKWKANGGYANRNKENKNNSKERIWFSPHCLKSNQPTLFTF